MFGLQPTYLYTRERKEYGRQINFKCKAAQLVVDIEPDPEMKATHVRLNPADSGTQIAPSLAGHEVLTYKTPYKRRNDNHFDTGWPKEINVNDPDQLVRYRKKQEKDENLIKLLPSFMKRMAAAMNQNIAVNIYENYFGDADWEMVPDLGPAAVKELNVFRPLKDSRAPHLPVSTISWSEFDGGDKLAVTLADFTYQMTNDYPNLSYVWAMGNQIAPYAILQSPFPCTVLEFNERDPACLAGGLYNGQVAYYDVRQGRSPAALSPLYTSFRDPVTCLLWTSSKTGTEFYSCSSDGQVIWWDVRNMDQPVESLVLDFTKGEEQRFNRAYGVSSSEFEHTIPTRFMLGTENGLVLSGNRKGKTMAEKFNYTFHAHSGPVRSIQRNPSFLKNFITAGDWTVRIWSEDCKESSIVWTFHHPCELTKAFWSPVKASVFFVTRTDGVLDIWDLMIDQENPIFSTKLADYSLTAMRAHEDGEMLAVGDAQGRVHVIELSDPLHEPGKYDKPVIAALFERESRREKLIEGKVREMKLKAQQKAPHEEKVTEEEKEAIIEHSNNHFFNTIKTLEAGGKLKNAQEEYD